MSIQSAEFLEAIMRLPASGRLTQHEVDWSQYEQLLKLVDDRPKLRMTFDSGRLEVIITSAITAEHIANFVKDGQTQGPSLAERAVRSWLRAIK